LSGCVNKQNFRHWAENNPRQLHERPLHSQRVTVWCDVADFGVIGPYFFEDGESHSNFRSLCADVTWLPGAETERAWKSSSMVPTGWCHRSHDERTMGVLREMFPGRISLRGDIPWPARSPDLAACDFFLWGHLKAEVYKRRPRTTDELKAAIQHEIAAIPPEITRRVMRNFRVRLRMCIENEGRHLDDIIKIKGEKSNIVLPDCQITVWKWKTFFHIVK
jgi:hypothetical protein